MAAPRVSLEALREPLGLMRALQAFFSVLAFSTLGGFEGSVSFLVSCAGQSNVSVSAPFAFPFRLHLSTFQPSLPQLCNHTWPRDVHLVGDFAPPSRFFLAVAVGGFLLALGGLGGYLAYLHLYRAPGARLPLL
ncbi:synaptophysin-like protein 1, partial [Myiozetetes cayanensis]|uniref:synaptophysin-like protein 1 n=1 Tax=Myiozetetes cayanensis TaxID=478635 RepID=UPI002160EF8C